MMTWSSPSNVKIVGIEGHSPETLRDEVERGGRFVMYSYSVSLVVVSFKRTSGIYFLPAGRNSAMKGLPFTLISLLFGWWGIPWGIIYTFQSLHQNLTGGRDVTATVMTSLAPVSPARKTAAAVATSAPAAPPPVTPARRRARWVELAPVAGVVALLAGTVYLVVCAFSGRTVRIALVSGLPAPYVVNLNGQDHTLVSTTPKLIEAPAGKFALRGAPGQSGTETFDASIGFFSRPFDRRVLVVNPDRAAIVFTEQVTYYANTASAPKDGAAPVTLHANRTWHHLPAPDYFFEDPPKTVSMPSGTRVLRKPRIAEWTGADLDTRVKALSERLGAAAAQAYAENYARLQPDDDLAQRQLVTVLKPADARRVLESRLHDRPVLVEWHRSYQYLMDRYFPEFDLAGQYRAAIQSEPANGALLYLYGRLLMDPAAARPLYEQALRAQPPCGFAAYALATDAIAQGNYSEALPLLEQAANAGVSGAAIELRRHDALLALGRIDELLSSAQARRRAQPEDTAAFVEELVLSQSRAPNRRIGLQAIAGFVAAIRTKYGEGQDEALNRYLAAQLAYVLGDEAAAAEQLDGLKSPGYDFQAAVDRRSHLAAAEAAAKIEQLGSHHQLIMMLTAYAAGDAQAAETYFQKALDTMNGEDQYGRRLARACRGTGPIDHDAILQTPSFAEELRVLFTVLGVRYPEQRERYFNRARELDRSPMFPHLLLQAVRNERRPGMKS